jgi:hypothetical protein
MNQDAFKLICQNCGSNNTGSQAFDCGACGSPHTEYECWDCGQKESWLGTITPGDPAKKVVKP